MLQNTVINNRDVRVVEWYEAGILSQQPGFDFRPGKKPQKLIKKPPNVPLMTASCRTYLKMNF